MAKDDHWIEHAHLNKGGLHRALHIPESKSIPSGRIAKAEHAENPHLAKMAKTAETLAHLRRKHGGSV